MRRAIAAYLSALLAGACSQPPEPASPRVAEEVSPPEEVSSHEFQWEVTVATVQAAPRLGDMAADFSLAKVGGGTVRLSDAFAKGPVVLVFGSSTCPPFRMKTPQFEELAKQLEGKVQFFIVYSREAHAEAADSGPINDVANSLIAMDADGDGATTLAEFDGPRLTFDAFDLDGDERLVAHEFLVARRIDDFASFSAPLTDAERMQAATRFRAAIPGEIPVVVDTLDNATSLAYGGLPNSAFVIEKGGEIKAKHAWATTQRVETALATLLGQAATKQRALLPDWGVVEAQLARAKAADKRLLIQFTAPGCAACAGMNDTTLVDPKIQTLVSKFESTRLDIAKDDAWNLFETLDFSGTPAFVMLSGEGKVLGRTQGFQDAETFAKFLQG